MSIEFWLRCEPQIRPTRLTINFFVPGLTINYYLIKLDTRFVPQDCEISPYFLQFLFCVRIALKKFTQVLSYVLCTQVRRHIHKRITKRRYGEEKPRRFVFGKLVLFTLGVGLITTYSFGVLV